MNYQKFRRLLIVPTTITGFGENRRTLPALDVHLEVSIDWDSIIRQFGTRAARSKSGRCSMLGGKLKIKTLHIKERTE